MRFIDANVILRYILDDHAELSPKAKKLIGENMVETPIEALCEVVFVLSRTYGIARKDIADTLLDFFENTNCLLPHREAVIRGIEYFGDKNLDFVDCILAGYYEAENITIHTFDAKLEKLLTVIAKTKSEVSFLVLRRWCLAAHKKTPRRARGFYCCVAPPVQLNRWFAASSRL